jgi:hypothetical protein
MLPEPVLGMVLPPELDVVPVLPPALGVVVPDWLVPDFTFPELEPPDMDPPGCVGELGCVADGEGWVLPLPPPVEGELPEPEPPVWASAGATITPTIPAAAASAIHRDAMFLCLLGASRSVTVRLPLG